MYDYLIFVYEFGKGMVMDLYNFDISMDGEGLVSKLIDSVDFKSSDGF